MSDRQATARSRRRWLILSHAFNMDGRAASHTITDKIPFLIEAGVEPVVASACTGRRDNRFEHRQLVAVAPSGLKFDLRHMLKLRYGDGGRYRFMKGLYTLLLLPFYVIERALIHLESQWSWYIPAYRWGLKRIRKGDIEVIYSTGGANSAHYAGYLLARKTGLPWIVEVHDPMVHEASTGSRMAQWWAGRLERLICKHADHAWWFTETALERARQRNPELGDRGLVILPGCECPDFGNAAYRPSDKFEIGHFGSLSPTRNFSVFFEALRQLIDEGIINRSEVRLNVYGTELDSVSAASRDKLGLDDVVIVHGRLERDPQTGKSGRQQVIEAMKTSTALLLLHGTDAFCEEYIPSKLYEYLWTQRPILGLVWHNQTLEQLLAEAGHKIADASSVPAVKRELTALYTDWKNGGLPDNGYSSPYSTRRAVERILSLPKCAGTPAPHSR